MNEFRPTFIVHNVMISHKRYGIAKCKYLVKRNSLQKKNLYRLSTDEKPDYRKESPVYSETIYRILLCNNDYSIFFSPRH